MIFNRKPKGSKTKRSCAVCGKSSNGVNISLTLTKYNTDLRSQVTLSSNNKSVCELHAEALLMGIEEGIMKSIRQQKLNLE